MNIPTQMLKLRVQGMTCVHCERAITTELNSVEGIQDIVVDVTAGLVRLTCSKAPDPDAVAAAVDEAGFELIDSTWRDLRS